MSSLLLTILQTLLIVVFAPLLMGMVRAGKARFQNRVGPSIFQPYWALASLFRKEMTVTKHASWVFHTVPFMVFTSALALAVLVPTVSVQTGILNEASTIFLIAGVLALGSIFLVLGGMDVASAFGGMGSSREMTLASLVEAPLIVVLVTFAMAADEWSMGDIMHSFLQQPLVFSNPFLLVSFLAFLFVLLAENARYPVDNPATHLELTMVHEAMILEYSGPYLAMLELASAVKLTVFSLFFLGLLIPTGFIASWTLSGVAWGIIVLLLKCAVAGFFIACIESLIVKMRFYRMQEYMSMAYFLALGGFVLVFIFLR